MQNKDKVLKILEKYDIKYNNINNVCMAFVHSSYVNEHKNVSLEDNERLEYLGDAVLELLISNYLYNDEEQYSEGDMTKLRAQYVCESSLVKYAYRLNISSVLLLGNGEELSGGRERPAILADAFEAFLGALFLDCGLNEVAKIIDNVVIPMIKQGVLSEIVDYKSELQELVQADNRRSVVYEIIDERGPAHNKTFIAEVYMDDIKMGNGKGKTKKEAEQSAAKMALELLAKNK